jgi:hypothetical protein
MEYQDYIEEIKTQEVGIVSKLHKKQEEEEEHW